jgi:putative transcriptional regulator
MSESIAGRFLVACKRLRDPNFFKAVVLMVEHGAKGAMGLVVNRPSQVTVSHALVQHFELPETDDVVYVGGPVEPAALFVLHNAPALDHDGTPVVPGLYVGSSAEVFERVVRSAAEGMPGLDFRIFSGCAGWAPGQLESELGRGDWHLIPATANFILHDAPYDVWDEAIAKVHSANRIAPPHPINPELN